jgi:hypothetical protein
VNSTCCCCCCCCCFVALLLNMHSDAAMPACACNALMQVLDVLFAAQPV